MVELLWSSLSSAPGVPGGRGARAKVGAGGRGDTMRAPPVTRQGWDRGATGMRDEEGQGRIETRGRGKVFAIHPVFIMISSRVESGMKGNGWRLDRVRNGEGKWAG